MDRIGQGGFGCVRSAIWRGTNVALKVLNDRSIDSREFYLEIKILTRLHHPNILQVLGCCTTQKPIAIVLEFMANGSLEFYVNPKQKNYILSSRQKNLIVQDISRGIAYLHNRKPSGIIHRDLKPSNILLSRSFTAKIADFGISSLRPTPDEFYMMTGETGTYRYMAPEVLKSESYNCLVDIWSFGLIVYAMYVGLPFQGFTKDDMFKAIINGPLIANLPLNTIKDPIIRNLIVRTVVSNPEDRWDSTYTVNYCNASLNTTMHKEEVNQGKKSILCCMKINDVKN